MSPTTGLLALASMAMMALVSAQHVLDTTGLKYKGFTMGSNVAGYNNMTLDACDIIKQANSGKWAAVSALYAEGKNSFGRAGLRKYKTWAASQHPGEPTFDMLASYHRNNSFLDNAILKAISDKNAVRVIHLITVTTHFKYMLHEVDAGYNGTLNGETNVTSGAPHAIDEAWALYAGAHPRQCTSLYQIADILAREMGAPSVTKAVTAQVNALYKATRTGKTAAKSYNTTRSSLRVSIATSLIQGVMRHSYAANVAASCKKSVTASTARSAAQVYWFTVAPQLKNWGASVTNLNKVDSALRASSVSYKTVRAALVACLPKAINVNALGTPKFALINKDRGCKAV